MFVHFILFFLFEFRSFQRGLNMLHSFKHWIDLLIFIFRHLINTYISPTWLFKSCNSILVPFSFLSQTHFLFKRHIFFSSFMNFTILINVVFLWFLILIIIGSELSKYYTSLILKVFFTIQPSRFTCFDVLISTKTRVLR